MHLISTKFIILKLSTATQTNKTTFTRIQIPIKIQQKRAAFIHWKPKEKQDRQHRRERERTDSIVAGIQTNDLRREIKRAKTAFIGKIDCTEVIHGFSEVFAIMDGHHRIGPVILRHRPDVCPLRPLAQRRTLLPVVGWHRDQAFRRGWGEIGVAIGEKNTMKRKV